MRKNVLRTSAVLSVLAVVVISCGSSKTDRAGGRENAGTQKFTSLLTNKGPCDTSLPAYNVGILTVVDTALHSLMDDTVALGAAIKAFNERGGVGKHCMDLTICDSQGDPNKELDCARQFVAYGIVATLSDTTTADVQGVKEVMEAAGIPRVGISPGPQDLSSTVAFPLDAGGPGISLMLIPGCTRHGHTKLAAIHVDHPLIGSLFAAMDPMLKAYNATLDTKLPVTAGTNDFKQLTLQARNRGATCAIIPLSLNEATQVLQAAKDVDTDLTFSGTGYTFSADDMKSFGSFARHIYLTSAFPPASASQVTWPILADVINDLRPTGRTATTIKTSSIRPWLATYALVTIVEKFGQPDEISSAAIAAALKAAKDVDMFGLVPPWTPRAVPGSPLSAVSQPWYHLVTYDADGTVTVSKQLYNIINEIAGQIDYPQPM